MKGCHAHGDTSPDKTQHARQQHQEGGMSMFHAGDPGMDAGQVSSALVVALTSSTDSHCLSLHFIYKMG